MVRIKNVRVLDWQTGAFRPTRKQLDFINKWHTERGDCPTGCIKSKVGFANVRNDGRVYTFCRKCGDRMLSMDKTSWRGLGRTIFYLDHSPTEDDEFAPLPIRLIKPVLCREPAPFSLSQIEIVPVVFMEKGEAIHD